MNRICRARIEFEGALVNGEYSSSSSMLSYDVVEWGKPLERIERQTPIPIAAEVLLKLKYCGVCHSDAHIRDGYFELGGGKRLLMSERGMEPPVTLGHEPLGTVVAAGPDAGDVPIGQDRLVYPWIGCGACMRCGEGTDQYCMGPQMIGIQRRGGYADHLIVPHARYLIDCAGIDPLWATILSCSGLSSYAAVSKLRPIPVAEWIAVIGVGGLGLSAVGMLRAVGHERIVAVDIDSDKLAMAEKAGAAATLNTRRGDALLDLKKITRHALFGAIDFVGGTETAQLAISSLRKGGRLVLVGLFGGEIPLSIAGTILRAITVQGSHLGSLEELKTVVRLARAGQITPIPIEKRSFSDLNRTLDQLKSGSVTGRVVIAI